MRADYLSHVGAVRENNEDAIYCDADSGVFVLADGVGGKEAGEVASATVVRIVAEHTWANRESPTGDMLREAVYKANDFLYHRGRRPGLSGMGTTLTAAVVDEDNITIVHVGDTRAYLFNKGELRQLTQDHSLVEQWRQEGKITAEEARNHPRRNILLRAVGQDPLVEVDTIETTWEKGDYLLLCSDGLYSLVDDEEMQEITLRCAQLSTAVTFLAEAAYKRGGYDNISVIIAAHD